jgi:hypothetical protein
MLGHIEVNELVTRKGGFDLWLIFLCFKSRTEPILKIFLKLKLGKIRMFVNFRMFWRVSQVNKSKWLLCVIGANTQSKELRDQNDYTSSPNVGYFSPYPWWDFPLWCLRTFSTSAPYRFATWDFYNLYFLSLRGSQSPISRTRQYRSCSSLNLTFTH